MTAPGGWTPIRDPSAALVAALLVLLLLPGLVVATATPAHAHSAVLSVAPEEGATVSAVRDVRVVFNEDVRPEVSALVVTGSDGQRHDDGSPVVSGAEVSVAVDADLPPGETTVAYRVVSADGHPVAGQYSFRFTPTAQPSVAPGAAPEGEASDPAGAAQTADAETSTAPIVVSLVTIPLMALALFLLIRFGLTRHTRPADGDPEPGEPQHPLPATREPDE